MVYAGQPQGGIALHSFKADQNILQGSVHGVAHMELARDVGRGHDDGKGFLFRVTAGMEIAVVGPEAINPVFHLFGVIDLWEFSGHSCFSYSGYFNWMAAAKNTALRHAQGGVDRGTT